MYDTTGCASTLFQRSSAISLARIGPSTRSFLRSGLDRGCGFTMTYRGSAQRHEFLISLVRFEPDERRIIHRTCLQPAVRLPDQESAGVASIPCIGAGLDVAALATAFFTTGFFTAAFLATTDGALVTARPFFALTFLAAAFGGAVFFVAFLTGAGFEVVAAPSSAPAIRNLERSLAPASRAGAGPRPLQVEPVLGSRYLVLQP